MPCVCSHDMHARSAWPRSTQRRVADSGKLKYLRWENSNCATCSNDRCLNTGRVYEGEQVYACARKTVDECTCTQAANSRNCTNNAQDPFACESTLPLC